MKEDSLCDMPKDEKKLARRILQKTVRFSTCMI